MGRLAFVFTIAVIAYFEGATASTVTYGDLGSFTYGIGTSRCHHDQPESPEAIVIRFWLYTNSNPTSPQELVRTSSLSILNSNFKSYRNTKFLIHGYQDAYTRSHWQALKDALLTKNVNVIMVDWKEGAGRLNYAQSRANTRVVGREIGKLIEQLLSVGGASYSSMHVIGHSLGAHTAGYAGEARSGIGRVTGLDPAGPEFTGCETFTRLDKSDANYVDAIHTDGTDGVVPYGLLDESGHQDFYPNGGGEQPGCATNVCDHMRAVDLFTESVISGCFNPTSVCTSWSSYPFCPSCGSCPKMGYDASKIYGEGCFYLTTNSNSPFC